MNRQTLTTVHDYFASIQEISPEEESLLDSLTHEFSYFQITAISRDDMKKRGFDVEKITDEDMEELARKMEESYIPNSFWHDMEEIARDMELPLKKSSKMSK